MKQLLAFFVVALMTVSGMAVAATAVETPEVLPDDFELSGLRFGWWNDWYRDQDNNRIDDILENTIRVNRFSRVQFLVDFDHVPTAWDLFELERLGCKILYVSRHIETVVVEVTPEAIDHILELRGVVMLEANLELLPLMYNAERSIHADLVRDIFLKRNGRYGFPGLGITVAVVDTGIDPDHRALDDMDDDVSTIDPKIMGFYDAINDEGGDYDDFRPFDSDENGHGTFNAAIIAGTRGGNPDNNNLGVIPKARLVGVRVLESSGRVLEDESNRFCTVDRSCDPLNTETDPDEHTGNTMHFLRGLDWIIDNKGNYGINVVSISIRSRAMSGDGDDAISRIVDTAVLTYEETDSPLFVIVGAGNEGAPMTIGPPGDARKAITVGSVDTMFVFDYRGAGPVTVIPPNIADEDVCEALVYTALDSLPGSSSATAELAYLVGMNTGSVVNCVDGITHRLSSFSSQGPTRDGRIKPDLVAHGGVAMTPLGETKMVSSAEAGTELGYVARSGTSVATPFVAGVMGQLMEAWFTVAHEVTDEITAYQRIRNTLKTCVVNGGGVECSNSIRQCLGNLGECNVDVRYGDTPNNGTGYGVIDAWGATFRVLNLGQPEIISVKPSQGAMIKNPSDYPEIRVSFKKENPLNCDTINRTTFKVVEAKDGGGGTEIPGTVVCIVEREDPRFNSIVMNVDTGGMRVGTSYIGVVSREVKDVYGQRLNITANIEDNCRPEAYANASWTWCFNTGDKNPPDPINDLRTGKTTSTYIQLVWSAPYDDTKGNSKADRYIIRYNNTGPIETEDVWNRSTNYVNFIPPMTAGTQQTWNIGELDYPHLKPDSNYWFNIRAIDEIGNLAPLSNTATDKTEPEDTIPPAAIMDLIARDAGYNSAILEWTAPGDDGWDGQASKYVVKISGLKTSGQGKIGAGYQFLEPLYSVDIKQDWTPLPGGSKEVRRVDWLMCDKMCLKPNKDYWFAIIAVDELPNPDIYNPTDEMFDAVLSNRWENHSDPEIAALSCPYREMNLADADQCIGRLEHIKTNPYESIPPAAISDLKIDNITSTTVDLIWQAVGDDRLNPGKASSYIVKYSTEGPISLSNLNDATVYKQDWDPIPRTFLPIYDIETRTVYDLEPDTKYWFVVLACDESDKCSSVSNTPYVTTEKFDGSNPGRITGLIASLPTSTSIELGWTSVGDDGTEGKATRYSIRYSRSAPVSSAGEWLVATEYPQEWRPLPAGEDEKYTIKGLLPSNNYFFAIRAIDEMNNYGPITYMIDSIQTGQPDPTAPDMITDLKITKVTSTSVTLQWTAPGDDGRRNGPAESYVIKHTGNGPYYGPRKFLDGLGEPDPEGEALKDIDWDDKDLIEYPQNIKPKTPGSVETFTLTGLYPSTIKDSDKTYSEYLFVVKALDDAPNYGFISNTVGTRMDFKDDIPPARIDDLNIVEISSNYVTLNWTAPGDDGNDVSRGPANQYVLWYNQSTELVIKRLQTETQLRNARPVDESLGWVPITTGMTETYTVRNLSVDTKYTFVLLAYDEVPNQSPLSNDVWFTTDVLDKIPPGEITDLSTANTTDSTVELTWTAPGDDGYKDDKRAYRYIIKYSLEPITRDNWNSATTFHTDQRPKYAGQRELYNVSGLAPGNWYYFAVRAIDEVPDQISKISNVVAKRSRYPDPVLPGAITDLRIDEANTTSTSINLIWMATGDNGWLGPLSGYQVLFAKFHFGIENISQAKEFSQSWVPLNPKEIETHTITGLAPDTEYWFAVKSIDEEPNYSTIFNVASGRTAPPDTIPPAAVNDMEAVDFISISVTLGWTAVGDDGRIGRAYSYDIRYSSDAPITEQTWDHSEKFEQDWVPKMTGLWEEYTVSGLEPNTEYWIALKVCDEAMLCSSLSNIVRAITEDADITPPEGIDDYSIVEYGDTYAKIVWTASGDDGILNGSAARYEIRYRTTGLITESNWEDSTLYSLSTKIIPTQPLLQETYLIIGLRPETQYWFAIKAFDEVNNTSPLSNVTMIQTRPEDTIGPRIFIDSIQPYYSSAIIQWHSNKRSKAVFEYGTTIEYGTRIVLDGMEYDQIVTLEGLDPATKYEFKITVTDIKGLVGNPLASSFLTRATARPPNAYIASIRPITTNQGANITFKGGGFGDWPVMNYLWYSSLDGDFSDIDAFTTSTLSAGTHTITFKVQDLNGTWSEEATTVLKILPPNKRPEISILTPGSGADVRDRLTITGFSSDAEGDTKYVQVRIDNGSWYIATGQDSWTYILDLSQLSDGVHNVTVRSFDGEEFSEENTVYFRVDKTEEAVSLFWISLCIMIAAIIAIPMVLWVTGRKYR